MSAADYLTPDQRSRLEAVGRNLALGRQETLESASAKMGRAIDDAIADMEAVRQIVELMVALLASGGTQ